MSYREPLATATAPGIMTIGTGLAIVDGVVSTGGFFAEAATPQVTVVADGITVVDSMSLIPGAGTYRVIFNCDYSIDPIPGDITLVAANEVSALYTTLTGLTPTGTHSATFGLGETITPGIYDVATAASIAGVLTLDGLGSATSVFVFRINGALTSVAASSMVLLNGALTSNIYWLAEGAVALGASTLFDGTAFAHNGAAGIGNGSGVNGRLISNFGAITTDGNTITNPVNPSVIPIGSTLSTFDLFTSNGNVTNINAGTYIGNVGTNLGVISGYDLPTLVVGGVYPPGSLGPTLTAFNIATYENGVLLPLSLRDITSTIAIGDRTLTSMTTATVAAGQPIDIRSEVTIGQLTVTNRSLTIFLA